MDGTSTHTGHVRLFYPNNVARPRYYEVIIATIKVRAAPSTSADVLTHHKARTVIECDAEHAGWVRLAQLVEGRRGWMLVDGSALGLGPLLRKRQGRRCPRRPDCASRRPRPRRSKG